VLFLETLKGNGNTNLSNLKQSLKTQPPPAVTRDITLEIIPAIIAKLIGTLTKQTSSPPLPQFNVVNRPKGKLNTELGKRGFHHKGYARYKGYIILCNNQLCPRL
jgi:hypothetical protein